jgi:hypothetical protein
MADQASVRLLRASMDRLVTLEGRQRRVEVRRAVHEGELGAM